MSDDQLRAFINKTVLDKQVRIRLPASPDLL